MFFEDWHGDLQLDCLLLLIFIISSKITHNHKFQVNCESIFLWIDSIIV